MSIIVLGLDSLFLKTLIQHIMKCRKRNFDMVY